MGKDDKETIINNEQKDRASKRNSIQKNVNFSEEVLSRFIEKKPPHGRIVTKGRATTEPSDPKPTPKED